MLKQTLNKFLVIPGVQAAIVVEENGEIIESIKSGIMIDKKNFDSIISTIMLDSKATALRFGSAPLSMVFVEFSDNFIILGPIAEEFFLLIIAKNTANIGQITYEMKKNQEDIASQL
jgi:predicted regulator of Ras-like GTPase activity (Roadblock/LC7/MglB family)